MTKKDYKIIAEVLRKHYLSLVPQHASYTAMLALDLAVALEKVNPNFDRHKWFNSIVPKKLPKEESKGA